LEKENKKSEAPTVTKKEEKETKKNEENDKGSKN